MSIATIAISAKSGPGLSTAPKVSRTNRTFLIPVVIDDTKVFGDALPVHLQQVLTKQATYLPAGQVTPEFLQSIRKTVTEYQKRKS